MSMDLHLQLHHIGNNLPEYIRLAADIRTFKRLLKHTTPDWLTTPKIFQTISTNQNVFFPASSCKY